MLSFTTNRAKAAGTRLLQSRCRLQQGCMNGSDWMHSVNANKLKNEGNVGCTYRSNSTRSGDEVSEDWINSGFPSSSSVCFSHSPIRCQTVESLSLTASKADAVLEKTHRKKSHLSNFLTGLIRPLSWSLPSPGPFFLSQLSPPPFALPANEKSLVEISYIEAKGNISTDWK